MARTQLRLLPGEYQPDWSASARGPISPIFLALVAGFAASGAALWQGFGSDRAGVFIFVVCGWLITLCLHEFMHAVAAYWGGDHTVAAKGYLRLDPTRYGHPLLTFILPVVYLLMGGLPLPGGAVLIENHRVRSKLKTSLVSLAGPAVNIAASVILLVALHVGGTGFARDHFALWAALAFLAFLEIATAILNLIPIPGLDGYGVIEPWLGREGRRLGDQIRPYGLLIMFALLFAVPSTRHLIGDWTYNVMDATGNELTKYGAAVGSSLFQFWRN
jgi:Zn-dependent protease